MTTTIGDIIGDELKQIKENIKEYKDENSLKLENKKTVNKDVKSNLSKRVSLSKKKDGIQIPLELVTAVEAEAAESQKRRLLAEIWELERQKRWQDILTLVYPLEEKYPLLVELELDHELRKKIAFALVRCSKHQKALELLLPILKKEPDNFMVAYSVAYAAYDALYLHKNRQLVLSQKEKQRLLSLAYECFEKCTQIRGNSVNVYYRIGMLFKEIEDKPRQAIPMFEKAINNWDSLTNDEKGKRHYERPKFIKSLYHLASCCVKLSLPSKSLNLLKRLIKEDEASNFIKPVFKFFALGKTYFALNRFEEALDYLRTAAAASEGGRPPDYIIELTAGCLLMLKQPEKALAEIDRISLRYMRPYVRWRRSDILVSLGRYEEALKTLEGALDKDGISRHKTLLRMARINYRLGSFSKALSDAKRAASFYKQRYLNELHEALFLQSLCYIGMQRIDRARHILEDLARQGFAYPGFNKALKQVRESASF